MIIYFIYGFWFWSNKLDGIIHMLSFLAKYELSDVEIDAIKILLLPTDDEENNWLDWTLAGKSHNIYLRLAYDSGQKPDMISIQISAPIELKDKLEALNLFQDMFKNLELEED